MIKSLTTNLKSNEDRGFIGIANRELNKQTAMALRTRKGRTYFRWVKGHQGDHMNESADNLAGQGSEKEYPERANLEVNPTSGLSGAKLQCLNQATAYKGIRETKIAKEKHIRGRTLSVISTIQDHMTDSTGMAPNEAQIWEAAKKLDEHNRRRIC